MELQGAVEDKLLKVFENTVKLVNDLIKKIDSGDIYQQVNTLKDGFSKLQKETATFLSNAETINDLWNDSSKNEVLLYKTKTDNLATELSKWIIKCNIELKKPGANIVNNVVVFSKSRIEKMDSLGLSLSKKITKADKLPQGLQLYFAVLENILKLARVLAGK